MVIEIKNAMVSKTIKSSDAVAISKKLLPETIDVINGTICLIILLVFKKMEPKIYCGIKNASASVTKIISPAWIPTKETTIKQSARIIIIFSPLLP